MQTQKLSWILRAPVKSWAKWCALLILTAGQLSQVAPWDLLASQPSLILEAESPQETLAQTVKGSGGPGLASGLHIHMHVLLHEHIHTPTFVYKENKSK